MDWTRSIFLYCERGSDPGFWAEPLNALSNVAFVAAAAAAALEWRRGARETPQGLLIVGVLAVAIGSFLFHTYANAWSSLADIVPIGVVMIGMLAFMLRRYFMASPWLARAGILAFLLAMAAAMQVRCGTGECLNGSVGYLPAWLGLAIIGISMRLKRHAAANSVLAATAVFAVALFLRTIDRPYCQVLTINGYATGSHFLWHGLNGIMLYLLLIAAVRHGSAPSAPAGIAKGT